MTLPAVRLGFSFTEERRANELCRVCQLIDFCSPRHFFPGVKWLDIQQLELHVFCDALLLPYCSVIYVQGVDVMKGEKVKKQTLDRSSLIMLPWEN